MHDTGDSESCVITDPDGVSETFYCFTNDIHIQVDPITQEAVTGRHSSAAVSIEDLIAAGMDGIRGVPDSDSKPWTVEISDVNGRSNTFKVRETHPDRSVGLMTLFFERYEV